MQGYRVMTVRDDPYPYLNLIRAHDEQTYPPFDLTTWLSMYLFTTPLYKLRKTIEDRR